VPDAAASQGPAAQLADSRARSQRDTAGNQLLHGTRNARSPTVCGGLFEHISVQPRGTASALPAAHHQGVRITRNDDGSVTL
jgi:hypothetical protein